MRVSTTDIRHAETGTSGAFVLYLGSRIQPRGLERGTQLVGCIARGA